MVRSKVLLISVALVFQAASTNYASTLVLDQFHQVDGNSDTIGMQLYQGAWSWQEFLPTMDNLEQIDLDLNGNEAPEGSAISFQLKDGSGTTLWTTSFSAADLDPYRFEWVTLDTPNILLVPEQTYRLYLTSSVPYHDEGMYMPLWGGAKGNEYDRGDSSLSPLLPGVDFEFRTWAVPEPATVLLLSLGGLLLRRRKSA